MRKLFSSLALFAIIAAMVAAGSLPTVTAQKKDKDEVGKIEVYQAKDGWRFRVVNEEGKSVAIGTVGYDKKEECLKVVDFVKHTMAKAKVTEVKTPKKEKDK